MYTNTVQKEKEKEKMVHKKLRENNIVFIDALWQMAPNISNTDRETEQ